MIAPFLQGFGTGFLICYGLGSLRSALRGGRLDSRDRAVRSLGAAIITTLAVTLLNPHFYLDTVFLLGSVSSQFGGESRLYFWSGAVSASTLWFICLSLVGRCLHPCSGNKYPGGFSIAWFAQPCGQSPCR